MLPEWLYGRYRQYKEDTKVFTTWLAHAAMKCGYNPNVQSQSQAVSEATDTHNIAPNVYPVTTREILCQVAAFTECANTVAIAYPKTIRRGLENAIKARKQCAAWFEESSRSTIGHSHFIEVLETASQDLAHLPTDVKLPSG